MLIITPWKKGAIRQVLIITPYSYSNWKVRSYVSFQLHVDESRVGQSTGWKVIKDQVGFHNNQIGIQNDKVGPQNDQVGR